MSWLCFPKHPSVLLSAASRRHFHSSSVVKATGRASSGIWPSCLWYPLRRRHLIDLTYSCDPRYFSFRRSLVISANSHFSYEVTASLEDELTDPLRAIISPGIVACVGFFLSLFDFPLWTSTEVWVRETNLRQCHWRIQFLFIKSVNILFIIQNIWGHDEDKVNQKGLIFLEFLL